MQQEEIISRLHTVILEADSRGLPRTAAELRKLVRTVCNNDLMAGARIEICSNMKNHFFPI